MMMVWLARIILNRYFSCQPWRAAVLIDQKTLFHGFFSSCVLPLFCLVAPGFVIQGQKGGKSYGNTIFFQKRQVRPVRIRQRALVWTLEHFS